MPDGTITITKASSCAPGATINVTLQNDGQDYGGRSWTIFPSASAGTFSQSSVVIGDATNGNPQSVTITWTAPATPQTVSFSFYTLPEAISASFGGGDCSQTFICLQIDYTSAVWTAYPGGDNCEISNAGSQWNISFYCGTLDQFDFLTAETSAHPNRPPESSGQWDYVDNFTGNDFNGLTHTESTTFSYSTTDAVVVGASVAHAAFLAFQE